jgi:hypothetical protein
MRTPLIGYYSHSSNIYVEKIGTTFLMKSISTSTLSHHSHFQLTIDMFCDSIIIITSLPNTYRIFVIYNVRNEYPQICGEKIAAQPF